MPDKLTDKEIVKDCKDCLHYEACKGTYSSAKGDENILYDFDGEMYANSGCEDFEDKDLINRLQEKIKFAENINHLQMEEMQSLKDKNKVLANELANSLQDAENKQAEIERLKDKHEQCAYEREMFLTELNDAKAENEQFKSINLLGEYKARLQVGNMIVCTHRIGEWFDFLQKTKAEAYKECIEKVKERLAVLSFTSNLTGYTDGMIDCMRWVESKIEEVEKELVGDNNA